MSTLTTEFIGVPAETNAVFLKEESDVRKALELDRQIENITNPNHKLLVYLMRHPIQYTGDSSGY